jgi:cyanate permease
MGTSVGPFVFGFSLDYLGSYHPAIWLGITLAAAALVAALLVKLPAKPL